MATLKVTVHEARDLPIMDRTTGLADPYVVVKLDDLECTTEIVNMSRHPVWNTVFRFDTPDLHILQEDPLEIRLYDHDIISRDDIVGLTFVDCNSMVLQNHPTMSGWFPLFDTSALDFHGEIRLTVKIKFHTSENPLAPRLPTRHVRLLPPRDAEYTTHSETPVIHTSDEFMPLRATRTQHRSLTAEDEGILIFSAWRLDPSVYRVESVLTMVEELIVKADPEHSRLTNLRSSRATNEARIIQLYKLSGKVRRQLSRKVVEMQCNAVLGYVEEFDMDSNGIIVRAYGTPCVLSAVNFVQQAKVEGPLPLPNTQAVVKPSDPFFSCASFETPPHKPNTNVPVQTCHPMVVPQAMKAPLTLNSPALTAKVSPLPSPDADAHLSTQRQWSNGGHVLLNPSSFSTQKSMMLNGGNDNTVAALLNLDPNSVEPLTTMVGTGTRTNVCILTLKDLPSGMIERIGGHISARSVKIVAKMKSKQMISQERDAWWMELREELKSNARAFHCNVILGYEEVVLQHEDVVVLSLFGTAVMLNTSMIPLRCGPEYLFQSAHNRRTAKKACSGLHLHPRSSHLNDSSSTTDKYDMCNICHLKPVPEVLLVSCSIPQEFTCKGEPRLVQVVVSKAKSATRGVDLALAVSQALPYIEYSLHKKLLAVLKTQKLNAVFGLRVTICIATDSIIGALTGTGCCLAALPISPGPQSKGVAPFLNSDAAIKPGMDVMAQRTWDRSPHQSGTQQKSRSTSLNSRSGDASAVISSLHTRPSSSSTTSFSDKEKEEDVDDTASPAKVSGSVLESKFGKGQRTSMANKVTDYVIEIEEEKGGEMSLDMLTSSSFEDTLLLTIPYVPGWVNNFGVQEHVVLNYRFPLGKARNGAISTATIRRYLVDAKYAYLWAACRVAMRRNLCPVHELRVTSLTFDLIVEPNSGALHVRLDGCLMTSTLPQLQRLKELGTRSFTECMRYVDGDFQLPPPSDEEDKNARRSDLAYVEKASPYHSEYLLFTTSCAPYSLPFVFNRDVPPPPLALYENTGASTSLVPDLPYCYTDTRARPSVVGRQWHALTTLASTAFRKLVIKAGVTSDGNSVVDASGRDKVATHLDSQSGGPMLHQPAQRLPKDLHTLETNNTNVIITPLDFVAGRGIARYVGRLSQHFIFEVYESHTPEDLEVFFQKSDFAMHCMVQVMVLLMGGNALLKHRMTYHEVWDSDGSGCASVFVTVTGDVVQTTTISLLPLISGDLCALSPNQSLYAYVKKSLIVVFMDYIRRTSELTSNILSGTENSRPSSRAAERCNRPSEAIISKHTALDEVHDLQWSPDSTLVSLLLARRQIVEVVSVYGKCCIARVDAGVAGLRAVRWHPSSRVVYWVGLLEAHALSLADHQVMRLAGGVKYSAQLTMLRSTAVSHPHSDTHATRWADHPLSEAALLRFSTCRRFLFYITPKSMQSPLTEKHGRETAETCASGEDVMHFPPITQTDDQTTEGPWRSEWLVVVSATTHEELHAFPTRHVVASVSECLALRGGIALVDYLHGSLGLITHNGSCVLYREASGVQNVVSSQKGDLLLIAFSDSCRVVLVSKKRVMALRSISFHADVQLPLQLRTMPLMEEPDFKEVVSANFLRTSKPYRQNMDDTSEYFNQSAKWSKEKIVEAHTRGHVAISASGKMAAVVLHSRPSWVLVIDIFQQRVEAVLRHLEPVMGLFWGPSSCSEFWRFQRRHYMSYGSSATASVNTSGSDVDGIKMKCSLYQEEEPLLVTTENHSGKFFLWLRNFATCYAASCRNFSESNNGTSVGCSSSSCNKKELEEKKPTQDSSCRKFDLPALRINRGVFSEDAAEAVLIDDVRGIALTVTFRDDAVGREQ